MDLGQFRVKGSMVMGILECGFWRMGNWGWGFFGVGDSDGDGGSAIAISAVWSDRSASVGVG